MAYITVEDIVKSAISQAFRIYNNITDDQIREGVSAYNRSEPYIWRKWPWHNRKIDELTGTPDVDGIITLDADVDIVCAVSSVGTDGDSRVLIWNEDQIKAAIDGVQVGSERFQRLSDDESGNRRIMVNVDDGVSEYKILAKRRFVRAIIDPAYDSLNPTLTPTDYRVLTWKIDRANEPLIEYVADQMREWSTQEKTGTWAHGINATVKDIREQEATDNVINPAEGSFGELGSFTW